MAGEFNEVAKLVDAQREQIETQDTEIQRLKAALATAGITSRS
jgi:uncharacterized membrane-anchored protein